MKRALFLGVLLASSCVASQEPVELALEVGGAGEAVLPLDGGGTLRLLRADLAFGPFTLCPGAQAGELCDTARLEWRDAAVVNALSGRVSNVGTLEGASGGVLSYMYDLGFVSLLGEPGSSLVTDAAQKVGGSLALAGEAEIAGVVVPFSSRVTVKAGADNEQGVPVVRKSSSEAFEHEVTRDDEALRITFDARNWVGGLGVSDFIQDRLCGQDSEVVCAGQTELSCDRGTEQERRDCAALGQICAPDHGCAERVELLETSAAYRSIVQALTAGQRPHFEFR